MADQLKNKWQKVAGLRHQTGHNVDVFYDSDDKKYKVRISSQHDDSTLEDVFNAYSEHVNGSGPFGVNEKDMETIGQVAETLISRLRPS